MRVLVTGMGGHLGTRVAEFLEARPDVEAVAGFDFVPPRRRLHRATFKRIDPRDRDRLVDFVLDFAPTALAHFGVYEPAARMSARAAALSTEECTVNAIGAAVRAGALERVVVRSGIEVYGRGPGCPELPDEHAPLEPTTPYGRICLDVEAHAAGAARRHDIPVAALRLAPVSGSRAPSPIGRLLRLPAVPVPAFADPPFQLLHTDDAATAMLEALVRGAEGAFNVVGPGAASPWQAVRLGNRIPIPVVGPGWLVARTFADVAGSPVPPHVLELVRAGRVADGAVEVEELGLRDLIPTQEVVADLYAWASVTSLPGAASTEAHEQSLRGMSPTVAGRAAVPNYGIDADRLLASDSVVEAVRRRFDGRYAVDEFGGDPHLQDLLLNPVVDRIRVEVRNGDRLPRLGAALLVANRRMGLAEPFVLAAAVHKRTRRRLRIAVTPDVPLVGALTHKLGGIGSRAADVAAVLRAGHLTAAPLAPSWWGVGAGEVPRELLAATMGFPVFPVAIRPGGPMGLWLRPWVVSVGEPLAPPAGTSLGDPLVAAELSEAVHHAIVELLEAAS